MFTVNAHICFMGILAALPTASLNGTLQQNPSWKVVFPPDSHDCLPLDHSGTCKEIVIVLVLLWNLANFNESVQIVMIPYDSCRFP